MEHLCKPLIAIVDDSAVVRTFTAFLLASYDFEVLFDAENGQECIDKMRGAEQIPDIIILDLEMPVMDGFQTAAILQKDWPGTKIIAFSSNNDQCSIDKILAAGAEAFVTKEKDITEKLIEILNDIWLDGRISIAS